MQIVSYDSWSVCARMLLEGLTWFNERPLNLWLFVMFLPAPPQTPQSGRRHGNAEVATHVQDM